MLEDERDLVRAADGLARMAALVAHPEFDAILDGAEFIGLCQAHELAAMPRYENRRTNEVKQGAVFRHVSFTFVPSLSWHNIIMESGQGSLGTVGESRAETRGETFLAFAGSASTAGCKRLSAEAGTPPAGKQKNAPSLLCGSNV
jgi:hypothetical protein